MQPSSLIRAFPRYPAPYAVYAHLAFSQKQSSSSFSFVCGTQAIPVTWKKQVFTKQTSLTQARVSHPLNQDEPRQLHCSTITNGIGKLHKQLRNFCSSLSKTGSTLFKSGNDNVDENAYHEDDNYVNVNNNSLIVFYYSLFLYNNNLENTWATYQETIKSRNYRKQPYWALHTYFG